MPGGSACRWGEGGDPRLWWRLPGPLLGLVGLTFWGLGGQGFRPTESEAHGLPGMSAPSTGNAVRGRSGGVRPSELGMLTGGEGAGGEGK